jgi:DNA-binding XRE family transcriptional regulator
MSSYTKWDRAAYIERAGGEEEAEGRRKVLMARQSGQRLAEERKRHGLTQAQLAQTMGVTPGRVSQIERGELATIDAVTSLATSSSPVCPSASAKSANSMSGQPGPSSRDVTSQAASCLGSGGAARQARAYKAVSIRRSPPMMPEESSICSIAAVTRSTARRASGTASAAPPDSIMSAIAPATSRARPEYSPRPRCGCCRRSRRNPSMNRFTSATRASATYPSNRR